VAEPELIDRPLSSSRGRRDLPTDECARVVGAEGRAFGRVANPLSTAHSRVCCAATFGQHMHATRTPLGRSSVVTCRGCPRDKCGTNGTGDLAARLKMSLCCAFL
jgi:hypothetical protein